MQYKRQYPSCISSSYHNVNLRNNTAFGQGHNCTAQYISVYFYLTSVHEVPSKITLSRPTSTKCRHIKSKSNETLAN